MRQARRARPRPSRHGGLTPHPGRSRAGSANIAARTTSGGRALFFTPGRRLEPQSGSASRSPKALAAYLRRSARRSGKPRAKVLTAEERHESARQAAEDRWARRKPR
jgi:hypothetical protein